MSLCQGLEGLFGYELNEGFRSLVFYPLRVFVKFTWAIMFFLEILSQCSESICPTKTNLDYFGVLYNVESIGIVRFMRNSVICNRCIFEYDRCNRCIVIHCNEVFDNGVFF